MTSLHLSFAVSPATVRLEDTQRTTELLASDGICRVRQAVSPQRLRLIRLAMTKALGAEPEDPAAWPRMRSPILKPLGQLPACAVWQEDVLKAWLDQYIGRPEWRVPASGGTWFVQGPRGVADAPLPRTSWHWDGRPDLQDCSGCWLFTLLEDLPLGHGGTLLIPGSHQQVLEFYDTLAMDLRGRRTKYLKNVFAESRPWFAALNEPGKAWPLDRPCMQVCGQAGDVIVMRPLTVHCRPAYIGPGPRLVHVIGATSR